MEKFKTIVHQVAFILSHHLLKRPT